ncbi:MAG TPA: NTP transferase domain-containing protein [Candidatus Limnocylindrales bacterium]|jgi:dTDP-glucose pyrophosphorylase|nr:NTP transferase domain-containing protein [Candidatus Limnocylindrales bacterium]
MAKTLLVLAAGMGSRYGGLKQIDPIGPSGETLMDYSVFDALRAGFDKVVFVIRREIERDFKSKIGRRYEQRVPVEYVYQELNCLPAGFNVPANRQKPWGTGHAVLVAAEAVREPFAAINADDFYGAESFRVLAQHLQSNTRDYAMVGFQLRNTLSDFGSVARGFCRVGPDGFLEDVVELTRIERDGDAAKYTDQAGVHPLSGDEIVSLNMWGFQSQIFPLLAREFVEFLKSNRQDERAEFFLSSVIGGLVTAGESNVKVLRTPDSWFGITYKADRALVISGIQRLIERGVYPQRLWG